MTVVETDQSVTLGPAHTEREGQAIAIDTQIGMESNLAMLNLHELLASIFGISRILDNHENHLSFNASFNGSTRIDDQRE